MGWSVSPSTATIDPNTGAANFPPNDGDTDMKYTVTYTDGRDCDASYEVVIPSCPGYKIRTEFRFQLIIQGQANNPIFNSLSLYMKVVDKDTGEAISQGYIGIPGCPCAGHTCLEEQKKNVHTFTFNERIMLSKPLSSYSFSIMSQGIIGRDWDDRGNCNYRFVGWAEPNVFTPGQPTPTTSNLSTTLDKLAPYSSLTILVYCTP